MLLMLVGRSHLNVWVFGRRARELGGILWGLSQRRGTVVLWSWSQGPRWRPRMPYAATHCWIRVSMLHIAEYKYECYTKVITSMNATHKWIQVWMPNTGEYNIDATQLSTSTKPNTATHCWIRVWSLYIVECEYECHIQVNASMNAKNTATLPCYA